MSEKKCVIFILYYDETTAENRNKIVESMKKEFGEVAEFCLLPAEHWQNSVNFSVKMKESGCCSQSILAWALIGFFADSFQEVKAVNIYIDGKRSRIFPRDVGTCS